MAKYFCITTKESLDEDDKAALFRSWLVVRDKIDASKSFSTWLSEQGFTVYFGIQEDKTLC